MLEKAKAILQQFWGYNSFRGSQADIIQSIFNKKDTLALMPTGGGKSICYQVPAMALDGICIVVSPLVALIQDQVTALRNKNIKAVALTGGLSFEEINALLDNCLYGNYKLLYLSPERLQQQLIQERIKGMNVNLVAIDEAHCISQWGNDFRPAYLECARLRELVPHAPIMALTATATPKVVKGIVQNLQLAQPNIFKDSFARENISISVEKREDKYFRLKQILLGTRESAIVYVRSRKMSMQLSTFLGQHGLKTSFFHGGLSRIDKETRLNAWLKNETQVMVATNAFGMGVDKPDVRTVVHFQIPDSLESYFQEAGRAGRDGKESKAILLTNEADKIRTKKQFLESLPQADFLKKLYRKLNSHFQVSYGELPVESFPFHFSNFCQHYALNPNLTYQGLKILDQNSVLTLSDNFKQQDSLQFLANQHVIFSFLDKNPKYQSTIQTLLRTYGGIFEFETKINLPLIAKKIGLTEDALHTQLKELHQYEVIHYHYTQGDFEIGFLVPREDDLTINVFAKKIKSLYRTKENNLKSLFDFIDNENRCRNRFLLNYFGESKRENCGKCDICIQNMGSTSDTLKDDILSILKKQTVTSRTLVSLLGSEEKQILRVLKHLLEEERIKLNLRNEYSLREH